MRKIGFTAIDILIIVLVLALLSALLFPVLHRDHRVPASTQCMNNQKQIMTSILIYVLDHQELLPTEDNAWASIDLSKKVLHCPKDTSSSRNSYVFNRRVSGMKLDEINASATIITMDGQHVGNGMKDHANMLYGARDLAFRHGTQDNRFLIASFCDGHVEMLTESDFSPRLMSGNISLHPKKIRLQNASPHK